MARPSLYWAGALYFLHADHLGSISLTTNGNGAATAIQKYKPYGEIRSDVGAGAMPTDIGFTAQRADFSTGLMYFRARYYSALLARFISADTIGAILGLC